MRRIWRTSNMPLGFAKKDGKTEHAPAEKLVREERDLRQAYKGAAAEDHAHGYSKEWDITVADGLEDEAW